MIKKILLFLSVVVLIFCSTAFACFAHPVSEYTEIRSFRIDLSATGVLPGEVRAFLVVPSGSALSISREGADDWTHTFDGVFYAFAARSTAGSNWYIEFRRTLDESTAAIYRINGADHIVVSDPNIKPSDILAFQAQIDVIDGVRWNATNESPFYSIKSTISHYLFADNLADVPFGEFWCSGIAILACLFVAGLPFLLVFFVLRRLL